MCEYVYSGGMRAWSAFFRPRMYEPDLASNVHSIDYLIEAENASSPVPPPTRLGGPPPPPGYPRKMPVRLYPNEVGPLYD